MTPPRRFPTLVSSLLIPRLTRPDPWLLSAVCCLVGLGVVMVFDVSYFHAEQLYGQPYAFFAKHVAAVVVGMLVMFAASRVRPEVLDRWSNILFGVAVLGLILVLIPGVGSVRGGARRWICGAGFCIQPSEIAKLATVFFLARAISRRRDVMHEFRAGLVPPLIAVGLCAGLMLLQPDFGTAVILGLLLILMLFVGGARVSHLAALSLVAGGLGVVGIMREGYRMRRLLAFLDPWEHAQDSAFQLVQSLIAFGSGGVLGLGLGQGRQKLFFLPEGHTDFIYALIGEELGLVGALLVLSLFLVIGVRGLRISSRHPDLFASLLAFGLTLVVILGAVVNVGVVLGLLPTKGLALPFVSYGGSAFLGAMLEIGVLAALSRMTG